MFEFICFSALPSNGFELQVFALPVFKVDSCASCLHVCREGWGCGLFKEGEGILLITVNFSVICARCKRRRKNPSEARKIVIRTRRNRTTQTTCDNGGKEAERGIFSLQSNANSVSITFFCWCDHKNLFLHKRFSMLLPASPCAATTEKFHSLFLFSAYSLRNFLVVCLLTYSGMFERVFQGKNVWRCDVCSIWLDFR